MTSPRMVLYEDLNCPFCYALSEEFEAHGLTRYFSWRGVQHAPNAPVPWGEPGASLSALIENEVETVRRRAPHLPIRRPNGQPNTAYATYCVADAMERNEAVGDRLKRAIKYALFRENRDISNPELIDNLRASLGLPKMGSLDQLTPKVERWQSEWVQIRPRMIPMIMTPTGKKRPGLGELADAVAFVRAELDAMAGHNLP